MAPFLSCLSEAELHGLVDGHIEQGRRVELLRRAASSPADRVRIEAWQEQAQALKTAFREIDREPLPASLNLHMPIRMQVAAAAANSNRAHTRWAFMRTRGIAGLSFAAAAASVLAAVVWLPGKGPGASWAALKAGLTSPTPGDAEVKGSIVPVRSVVLPDRSAVAMPVSIIPDVTFAGFTFRSAETRFEPEPHLMLHYRDSRGDELAISITRAAPRETAPREADLPVGDSLVLHKGSATYSIAGSVDSERLKAISAGLRDELQDE